MEIRKLIFNFFLFFTIVSGLYLSAMLVVTCLKVNSIPVSYRVLDAVNWKGGGTFTKFQEFDRNKKYDVIVIGSSHAYRGYDPRLFKKESINMFNLGTHSQSLLNSYYIAKYYITPSNCKMVLLDIYDGALANDGLESTADLTQNVSSTPCAFEMGLAMKDPRTINMLTVRMLTQHALPMYGDTNYIFNGFSEKKDILKEYDAKAYDTQLKFKNKQIEYLKSLLQFFKENNIHVVAVTHPSPKESHNLNFLKNRDLLNRITKEFGVDYWDYSLYELNTQTDFFDLHHLNQSGVEKFNAKLINDIKLKRIFEK